MPLLEKSIIKEAPQLPIGQQYSEFVRMPADRALQISQRSDFLARLSAAVAPFTLSVRSTALGLGMTGDAPAVTVARRVFDQAATLDHMAAVDTIFSQANLDAVVSGAMKRDLAFRLEGLIRPVRPLSFAQMALMKDLLNMSVPLIFGVGPTGTGKTHLAIAAGLTLLARNDVAHLVLTRPHERSDGDMGTSSSETDRGFNDQIAVFYDILYELTGHADIQSLINHRRLEIIPLSQMRGRTFNDSLVLIDEAQNLSARRMRMAVTRTGRRSRMVVTGDPSHVELKNGEPSGLAHLLDMLKDTDIARIHAFQPRQVIRNRTVARIESLYAGTPFEGFVDADLHDEEMTAETTRH
ncbi:PhoH family protein [Parvularcula sp. LCG005]|uniref:PhoH family protein n=1 Tax=Parvularcula sp. LCG005 TaxID=3078805 RepID=UPI002943E2F7|nr:PhoH family protein [Parvularcula sp. LCG005]WOI53253.1 PhoH family protein [Parvularcula sp. LCG005]